MTLANDSDTGAITTAYKNGKLVVNIGKKKLDEKTQPAIQKVESKKKDMKNKEHKPQDSNSTIKKRTLLDKTSMS